LRIISKDKSLKAIHNYSGRLLNVRKVANHLER
jgi:hypothetical protein